MTIAAPGGEVPVIGIVGNEGAYGRWLTRFCREQLGLRVIGSDPASAESLTPRQLVLQSDVLVFSVPIRATVRVIDTYVHAAAGAEAGKLWLDLTSIKQAPVEAMLRSRAEVVGLHPMAAPPKIECLKGRSLAVCAARLARWRPWVEHLLERLQADCIEIDPQVHDRAMALVQGLVHATHMGQAALLRELAPEIGGLATLLALRTVGLDLDLTVTGRLLAGNPSIYEDIQFDNPHVLPMLQRLCLALTRLRDEVARGDEAARSAMREGFLQETATWFGPSELAARSHAFERMGYLQADLRSRRFLSVYLPEDRPGSLRRVLEVFERLGVNLESIHSSRNADGELHFRFGLDRLPITLETLRDAVESAGMARIVDAGDAMS
ncbi:MAG: prephenate dehydrogenase [Chiayiivirga sp.]|jgi:prephenate dehydrogenase|uniref:prephenate dehydrogenase n=1 Tax=Chiayiivirga sp. TaxID=2041042 RepID=UPI0025C647F1|nr:prephenate dehydrogenase [Chiayiivirga sp.]MCI1709579.1 prephenate dehydrogenase [Chiayiivirga sp.]MCI1730133.1 prephenate dehydrogenase [Chiayiivirga sp.]